jgi:hypothetical protein
MARTTHNGNGHDPRHATETPDVSHIMNVDVTHEASDVSVSGVAKFVLGLTVMCVVVFVLIWGMFRFLYAQEETKEPDPGPMAMTPLERLPPDPRLQASKGFGVKLQNGQWVSLENREPQAEYQVLRQQWEQQLRCPEDSDPNMDVDIRTRRCLPIDEAMQKVVGLPSRKIISEGANARTEDFGLDRPTAASSGRMTEKGKEQ